MVRTILLYGVLLAAGAFGLEWLQYRFFVRAHPGEAWLALLALAFLALGVAVGFRLFRTPPASFDSNPEAQNSLGISPREMEVLELMAAGQSNKEIAASLNVSPNTIKTHIANLFEKLAVKRRTEAISRARELRMIR